MISREAGGFPYDRSCIKMMRRYSAIVKVNKNQGKSMTTPYKQPQTGSETASAEKVYSVTREQCPLSCPLPEMRLWDSHPRVYLPIEKTGKETCPYCGAQFVLVDEEKH